MDEFDGWRAEVWLAEQRTALLDSLLTALDTDAGLQEALLPARHDDLVEDLRAMLDLDAGLRAIVPDPDPDPAAGHDRAGAQAPPATSATAAFLDSLDAGTRLAARGAPAVLCLAVFFRIDLAIAAARSLQGDLALARALVPARDRAGDLARANAAARARPRALSRDLALGIAAELGHAMERPLAGDLARDLRLARELALGVADTLAPERASQADAAAEFGAVRADDPERAEALSQQLRAALDQDLRATTAGGHPDPALDADLERARGRDHGRDHGQAREHGEAREHSRGADGPLDRAVRRARELEAARSDFTRGDLRTADLGRVSLPGVRWSRRTRWPEEWTRRIERRSVPIGSGVFEIRDGKAERDVIAASG
jgi:hypothetical protein